MIYISKYKMNYVLKDITTTFALLEVATTVTVVVVET